MGSGLNRYSSWASDVLNSAAMGRRLALRMVVFQAAATVLTALACFILEPRAALAALVGGGGMTLGAALAAWITFGNGVIGAGEVLGRLLLGMALKWLVVIAGLYLAMAVWQLPAMPALAGAAVAVVANLFASKLGVTTRTNA